MTRRTPLAVTAVALLAGALSWPAAAQVETAPAPRADGALAYNAVMTADGRALPVYPVRDRDAAVKAVAFDRKAGVLTAYDPHRVLWSNRIGDGQVFGGFDFNGDGWLDLGVARSQDTGENCGTKPVHATWLDLIDGKTGRLIPHLTPPTRSKCWDFRTPADRDPAKNYPTEQWTTLSVLFGEGTNTLAVLLYYAQDGEFLTYRPDGGDFARRRFLFPSTAAFDAAYRGRARPSPWHPGTSFHQNAHTANGLIVAAPGGPRLVFFTSGRVVQYAVNAPSPGQLLADCPFMSGGRSDLSGRNYGLVMRDGRLPLVVLVAGTGANSVYSDMLSGKQQFDDWGQIERHVAVYNLQTNRIDDRFFSYAHDNHDANKYEGRVVYPAESLLPTAPGAPSRLAYNVYQAGRWYFHVSRPGASPDARIYKDLFVWDVRDLDGDGVKEVVASPAHDDTDPDVPGYYFVKWRTAIYHWDEANETLVGVKTFPGVIPHLVAAFREPTRTTSMGYLYPALTTVRDGRLKFVAMDGNKKVRLLDY
jgi:hypothetical protein